MPCDDVSESRQRGAKTERIAGDDGHEARLGSLDQFRNAVNVKCSATLPSRWRIEDHHSLLIIDVKAEVNDVPSVIVAEGGGKLLCSDSPLMNGFFPRKTDCECIRCRP